MFTPDMILLIVFVVVQIADVWSTNRAISNGAVEANPAIAWVMKVTGKLWPVVKLGVAIPSGVYLYHIGWFYPLLALTVVMAYIVYKNYKIGSD